ncbi:MAG: hypothetical protein IKD42_02330 [Kiritimatiellae bacterium]|nr:hypothetical protein [Kiritimatiellia bacterium]
MKKKIAGFVGATRALFVALAVSSPAVSFARDVKISLSHPKDGMEDVRKASFLGRDGKWKEGEAFIASLKARPHDGRNVEERQSVDMAEFGLFRTAKKARARRIKALKAAYDKGPSTFWGWAAWHYLKAEGVDLPMPERDPLRGLGEFGDGVVNLDVKMLEPSGLESKGSAAKLLAKAASEIPAVFRPEDFKKGSQTRRAILRARLVELCGEDAVDSVLGMKDGAALFARIWKDDDVLEDFLLSGPVFDAPVALEVLMTIFLNDGKDQWTRTGMGRKVAVAVAVNARGGKDFNMTLQIRHFAAFRRIGVWGRFHKDAQSHECSDWRFVVRYARDPGDTLYLNTRRFLNRYTRNIMFGVPYRFKNCFAVSKWARNDECMKPWTASEWPRQYIRSRVGGVCTEQAMYAALLCNAHGLMAERAGQPGHCCWLLKRGGQPWRIYAGVRPYTQGVFVFWGKGFQAIASVDRAFADRAAHDESELLRFASEHEAKKNGPRGHAGDLARKAALRCPYNIPAWRAYTDSLKKRGASAEEWKAYLAELYAGAPEGRLLTWNFVHEALDALESLKVGRAELAMETARAFKALPQPASWIAEEMNFRKDALGRALKRFGADKDLKMKIVVAALDANENSPAYLPQIFSVAFSEFAKDEARRGQFIALVARYAGGDDSKIDWRRLYRKSGALDGAPQFRMMARLRDELDPPKSFDAAPRRDFGAAFVGDAYLSVSSSGKGDAPEDRSRVCDLSSVAPERKFLLETKAEKSPWAVAELPGDVEIAGLRAEGELAGAKAAFSPDGKEWDEPRSFENAGGVFRIDLGDDRKLAKYVKIFLPGGDAPRPLRLRKFLVYGKTIY